MSKEMKYMGIEKKYKQKEDLKKEKDIYIKISKNIRKLKQQEYINEIENGDI